MRTVLRLAGTVLWLLGLAAFITILMVSVEVLRAGVMLLAMFTEAAAT